MEILRYKQTVDSPSVDMNPETGVITLLGKSYPENILKFYKPIIDWLNVYFDSIAKNQTIINFDISYFNSGSSKLFFTFFGILTKASKNFKIEVNWYYDVENENAIEAGEDFMKDFKELNINLIQKV